MIHNDIQNQLALLVKTSAPPLIEVADSPVEAPQWVPGQRLPAHVIASLPNGRFQVQVENQMLDMNLPRNTEPGEKLELTFLAAAPRMTFALTADIAKSLPSPSSSGVTLSETAKFLGALLQKSSDGGGEKIPSARIATNELARATAVIAGTPPPVREFAQALRTAVSQSGLFYESHQAQWVSGERTLASILQEPQARLPVPGVLNEQMPSRPASVNMPIAEAPAQHAAPFNRPVETPPVTGRDFGLQSSHGVEAQKVMISHDPVHPLAQPVVQQQLETLETRQLLWQGQVWPGQQMDWQIDEDSSNGAQEDEQAPGWRTRLHLDMPGLGGVTAKLVLNAGGIKVDFTVDRETTAAMMNEDIGALAQSMQASGLKVAGLMVHRDGAS